MIEILIFEILDPAGVEKPLIIISVDRSPNAPLNQLFSDLYQVMVKIYLLSSCTIVGDFNVDLLGRHQERELFLNYLSSKGFYPAIPGVSTNYDSQLDCVLTKSSAHSCSFNESYFSDHKPMFISLNTCISGISFENTPRSC